MPESITLTKARAFAVRVTKAKRFLNDNKNEFRISDQLYRSGTSIAANVSEAQYAQSKADFITKLHIALKEANESKNWIEILHDTDYFDDRAYQSINSDITEIIKLLISSINTAKKNTP